MPFDIIQKIAILALPILFAVTIHEAAHGWMADKFGDPTAKLLGRLTLNPIKHIDLIGTIIVPLVLLIFGGFIFGWAKPVPISPRNFSKPRLMMALVAFAGPASNLLMMLAWAAIAKLAMLATAYSASFRAVILMGQAGIIINAIIGVLNLLPIPPLDGGRIVSNIIPPKAAYYYDKIEPFGFFILIGLIVTNILSAILLPIINPLINLVHSLFIL